MLPTASQRPPRAQQGPEGGPTITAPGGFGCWHMGQETAHVWWAEMAMDRPGQHAQGPEDDQARGGGGKRVGAEGPRQGDQG